MDDKTLLDFMQKQTELTARIDQRVEDLHGRLFGNGQPGILRHISDMADSAKDETVRVRSELGTRINTLESYRKLDRRWLAGALAVLGAEGTALGIYSHYIAGKVAAIVNLVK